jgi:multiple sugar transport system permease protein
LSSTTPSVQIGRLQRDTGTALAMVAPAVIGLLAFVAIPFLLAMFLSTQNLHLGSDVPPRWMGLEQYRRILLDPDFRGDFYRALINNATFAVVVVPVQTGLALGIALLLNRRLRGMPVFRTFFFMPVVFPMALVSVIWKLIYARDDVGMLNSFLQVLTFGHWQAHDFLGDPHTAMIGIIVMSIWQGVGFQMVIILAGLQSISSTLYEAAAIDRANKWQQFLNVTLPGLRNTLIFVVMVTTIFSLRLFDQIYIMTRGGPQNSTTTVMYQAVTTAFEKGNVGNAAAITVIFFILVLAIALIQRQLVREEREIA